MAEVYEQHQKMHGIDNGARTLGIIGTALSGLGILGGAGLKLLGGGNNNNGNAQNPPQNPGGCPMPLTVQDVYIERKQCENYLDLTRQYYEGQINRINALNDTVAEGYKRDIDTRWNLYNYTRDSKDELNNKIDEVSKKVDVMMAVRPYQDALIDSKINNTALMADYNLYRRTCRMIQGELVLPNTPEVTGYASYSPFAPSVTTTTTTGTTTA